MYGNELIYKSEHPKGKVGDQFWNLYLVFLLQYKLFNVQPSTVIL
jgi:hypothetical protein